MSPHISLHNLGPLLLYLANLSSTSLYHRISYIYDYLIIFPSKTTYPYHIGLFSLIYPAKPPPSYTYSFLLPLFFLKFNFSYLMHYTLIHESSIAPHNSGESRARFNRIGKLHLPEPYNFVGLSSRLHERICRRCARSWPVPA